MQKIMLVVVSLGAAVPAVWAGTPPVAPVPEPGTMLLMGVGLGAVALLARKRRSK